jgi:glycosyltransferase involved in cell wall biosynthesis
MPPDARPAAAERPLRVALVTLGEPTRLTGGYLYHLRVAELAPRHGARVDFVSFPAWPFPLPRLAAPVVARRVAALAPDAVLLDSIAAAFVGAPRSGASKWGGGRWPPLLAILHQPPGGIGHRAWRTTLQARLDRRAYAPAALLLVASASLAEELVALGFARSALRVAAPGRDVAAGTPRPAEDLRRGRDAAFLCVANWLPHKGLLDLLAAFAALPPQAATLHLAGDEEADPAHGARLRALLAHPDLAGRVVRHGKLPRNAVAGLYAAADAFVLPSWRESYGTVYGEAMSAGLPVVGWRAGNLPHLVTDEVEGLILEPGDIGGLTAALARLAGDPTLRRRLGVAAARRSATLPTWDDTTALIVASIREVVAAFSSEER